MLSLQKVVMINNKVLILSGLPASGKSCWAKEWVAKDPTNRVRVNKDDLRALLHGGKYSKGNEKQVLRLEEFIIVDSLINGKSIVVDNTHLATNKDGSNKHYKRIEQLITCNPELVDRGLNITLELKEFNLPPEECIKRDLQRPNSVGQGIIWRMYWNHVANVQEAPVEQSNLPDCIIVDVDGTLADMKGRHPFQWDKVIEDNCRTHIWRLVDQYDINNYEIIIFTGRDGCCLEDTKNWLAKHQIRYDKVFIRPEGDDRPDYIVKREMYESNIRDKYNVVLVIDDRPQVIREWRRLGLPVINANPCDREF